MLLQNPTRRLIHMLTVFCRSEKASVALTAAILAATLTAGAGIAVDQVRLIYASSLLQNVLDGAALAAAAPVNMTDTQRVVIANTYLDRQMGTVRDFTRSKTSVAIKGKRVQPSPPRSCASLVSTR